MILLFCGFDLLQPFISTEERMPFLTSAGLMLLGCIIFLFNWKNNINSGLAHILNIIIFLISYFIVGSYILGIYYVTEFNKLPVSLLCGLAFFFLVVAVMLMRPDTWLMRLYLVRNTSGVISRSLIIPAIFLPFAIGWIHLQGDKSDFFSYEEGVTITATLYTLLLGTLTSIASSYVKKIDKKRASSEEALINSEKRYREHSSRFEAISSILNSTFSLSDEEAVGLKCLEITKKLIGCESAFIVLLNNNIPITIAASIPHENYSLLNKLCLS